jgi:pimeloyl-ACP methyl ester carboxylesterase
MPDYTGALAAELAGIFAAHRYTQRGVEPSPAGPPFTIEQHMADALAVLDAHSIDRAWAIGHSWGGHLALHLAVAHPDRLLGLVCIDPLGASASVFGPMGEALGRHLTDGERARISEIEADRRAGKGSKAVLLERLGLIWPGYFTGAVPPPPPPKHFGVDCSIGTNASIVAHFEAGTLARGLPAVRMPSLFVHGRRSALPPSASIDTAALIRGAEVVLVEEGGHFPWVEVPGCVREAVAGWSALRG